MPLYQQQPAPLASGEAPGYETLRNGGQRRQWLVLAPSIFPALPTLPTDSGCQLLLFIITILLITYTDN